MNASKGRDLVTIAKELQYLQTNAKDYIVPTAALAMNSTGNLEFTNGKTHEYKPTHWAHGQLMSYVDIPRAYGERLRSENPELLARNVNFGLNRVTSRAKDARESRMLRTVDGKLRAVLSSRFLDFGMYDLANIVFPMAMEKGLHYETGEITEKRLYARFLSPKLTGEVKPGDVMQYGFQVSTSDVGAGAVQFEGFFKRLVCKNGLITLQTFRRLHVGRNNATGNIEELLSTQTKTAMKDALTGQIKDVVLAGLNQETFETELQKMRDASTREIENRNPMEVIELAMNATGIHGEDTANNLIAALATGNEGAGYTQWGLVNAFTRVGRDEQDFDRAVEFERAGNAILNMAPNDWSRIAAA